MRNLVLSNCFSISFVDIYYFAILVECVSEIKVLIDFKNIVTTIHIN